MPRNARRHHPISHEVTEVEAEGVRVLVRKPPVVDLALAQLGVVADPSWLNGVEWEGRSGSCLQQVA